MKHVRNKPKKKYGGRIAAGIIVLAVIVGIAAWLILEHMPETESTEPAATAAAEATSTPEATAAPETTEAAEESTAPERNVEPVELVNGEIQTPYGTLHYPDALADHLILVQSSSEPYTLEFYAAMEGKAEIRLFDISLGEGSGGNVGLVKTPAGEVPMHVTIYSLPLDESWTEGEITTAQAMQDVVNDIIEEMSPQAGQDTPAAPALSAQPVQSDTVNYLEIVTPSCSLYYPAQWRNTLRVEHVEQEDGIYKVHFYGKMEGKEEQLLFSIYFGGDEGEQLGAVMGADGTPVSVNILLAELNLEGWEEDAAEILYSMQEAANQLIEKLDLI